MHVADVMGSIRTARPQWEDTYIYIYIYRYRYIICKSWRWMKMSDLPPHDHNIDPTSSTMHHTVQAACMQVMSLTSHILAHGIAVTDRPSGGATNIVVGKGYVNNWNECVFSCSVEPINIDHRGIGSVAAVGTANSTPQFISGVGTTPGRARAGSIHGHTPEEENIVQAGLALYVRQMVNQPIEGKALRNKTKTVCIGSIACWNGDVNPAKCVCVCLCVCVSWWCNSIVRACARALWEGRKSE